MLQSSPLQDAIEMNSRLDQHIAIAAECLGTRYECHAFSLYDVHTEALALYSELENASCLRLPVTVVDLSSSIYKICTRKYPTYFLR